MVLSRPKVSRNPLASCPFEKSYTPRGAFWHNPGRLNPLLAPELKMQILITEMFDQLSDSIMRLDPD